MSYIPRIVFIVPYRDRPTHKYFFSSYMTSCIMKKSNIPYEIYFSHQCDKESPFNRGGTKNIGFIALKKKYPLHYKNMTFVFNDVDTMPFANIFDYETKPGVVKHFYGFTHALGGIVSIIGRDFEKINGFPNYWGWGKEDNDLQTRCVSNGISIDRSQFQKIGSKDILQLFDGILRLLDLDIKKNEFVYSMDGIMTIHNLKYTIDKLSTQPEDNIHIINDNRIFIINISSFATPINSNKVKLVDYNLRSKRW